VDPDTGQGRAGQRDHCRLQGVGGEWDLIAGRVGGFHHCPLLNHS